MSNIEELEKKIEELEKEKQSLLESLWKERTKISILLSLIDKLSRLSREYVENVHLIIKGYSSDLPE